MSSLYCTLFLDGDLTYGQLLAHIERFLGADRSASNLIESRHLSVYADENDDFDTSSSHGTDGFLFYRYRLSIEPVDGTTATDYMQSLKTLFLWLREQGWRATPACDFEDYLWCGIDLDSRSQESATENGNDT